ncbi:MAG TPA: aminoglycoside phosphotransferase family protein [Acidimicrobiales bacterium]|nr:aminoglycoside phosphotransferase family protein [Acidimicrobiales bacterium]
MNRSPGSDVIREATAAFDFAGDVIHTSRLPGGHIHRNFLVTCRGGRYVLQRLNGTVFLDLSLVLANVERLTHHLAASGWCAPGLVLARDGTFSFRTVDGGTWRAFHYLEGTVGGDTLGRPQAAYEAARCCAAYLLAIADLPGPPLLETIDHFHDLPYRMDGLDAVANSDPVGRRSSVDDQIDRARRLGQMVFDELTSRGGRTPVRLVHNDAKLSNVLFDAKNGQAVCIIDFDTTMPGQVRHDVGELVRTAISHAPEDATDEAAVDFDLELLDGLACGFFAGSIELEPSEVTVLAVGGAEMAVENAVRFLADHIAGDRYFAIDRPAQNLDRCRTQLRLTELMLDAQSEVDSCFHRAAGIATPEVRRSASRGIGRR